MERRSSTSAACSVALFTLGMSDASVVRRPGSAALSALTKGMKSALSGFLSINLAKTVSRERWTFASGALPVTTSSSLMRSGVCGSSTATTNDSISSGAFHTADLNWLRRSFPESIEGPA